jgi:uncharacterized protein
MAKSTLVKRLGNRAAIGVAAVCGLALMTGPVLAQFGQRGGGMFDFFGPFSGQPRYNAPSERPSDFTRAPPPRKLDNQPATSVVVFGDSMADWLAHGLEDALGDTPDIAVIRKNRAAAGLIRYDTRNENHDWPQIIRETLAQSKPNFVVMMIGLNDRQQLRDRPIQSGPPGASNTTTPPPLVPQAAMPAPAVPAVPDAERPASDQPSIAGAEQQKAAAGLRTYEFRTDEWAEHYTRRIDATVAALKSAGVPVFWVGLPSIRGPKSTSEMLYLNDLFRTRVEKAGVAYIDIWDGFVDESGRFAVQGPDFEGQIRRLRVSDGVHFTKSGARKLAHYLEREVRRVMQRGTEPAVAALPVEPQLPAPKGPGAATARPLSGPVVPLTAQATANQDLLGGAAETPAAIPRAVTRVLVKGEPLTPPAGRSDDFRWPRRGIAAFGTDSTVATTTDPVPAAAAPATPAPAIASVSRPDAKADNKANAAGSRKTTARAQQPQQAQRQVRPQQRPRRERDNDNFGGGFQGFGR